MKWRKLSDIAIALKITKCYSRKIPDLWCVTHVLCYGLQSKYNNMFLFLGDALLFLPPKIVACETSQYK